MRNFFQKTTWPFPKSKKEEAEFGPARKNILICPDCNAAYWHKSWHHHLDDYPKISQDKNIKFVPCPACRMVKDGKYEGEVLIESVPEAKREELENLINNFGQRAFAKDPMDRIISISIIAKGMIRVLTTENQMAKRLVKKIKQSFKGRVSFIYSRSESTLRAKISL